MSSINAPFNDNYTNNYYADALAELARLYNEHNHFTPQVKSFLLYDLVVGQEVQFFSATGTSDPFQAIGSTIPLTISNITASELTLSRAASVSVGGILAYYKNFEYIKIANVLCIGNSPAINWVIQDLEAGSITGALLEKLLRKTYSSYYPLNYPLQAVSSLPPSSAIVNNIAVSIIDDFFYFGGYLQPNPRVSLVRGQVYNFNLTSQALSAGGLKIVKELVSPAYPLKYWAAGVSNITTAGQITGVSFYVPTIAPTNLFYQSSTSPFRYGTFEITGGELTTANSVYAFWRSSNTPEIPAEAPEKIIPISISSVSSLRLLRWSVYPEWANVASIGHVFIQLQLHELGQPIKALSMLKLLETTGKQTFNLNQGIILNENSFIVCAVYSPSKISGLFQEVYVTEIA